MKEIHLRVPEEIAAWIKENIEKGQVNKFFIEIVQQHIQSQLSADVETAAEVEQPELPEDIKKLLELRQKLCEMYGDQHVNEVEHLITKEREFKVEPYEEWDERTKEFYRANEGHPHWRVVAHQYGFINEDYFNEYASMPWPKLEILLAEIEKITEEKEQKERKLRGMDDIIVAGWTKEKILEALEYNTDKGFSCSEIAGKLGISYMQCYNRVVPMLMSEGYKIVKRRKWPP